MESYIAFLDILGFKKLVQNNEHDELVRLIENLFTLGIQTSISREEYQLIEKNGEQTYTPELTNSRLNCLHVSDSVIFWTDDDSMTSFIDLTGTVRNFVIRSIQFGFPLRGAIAWGKMKYLKKEFSVNRHISQQSLIGKGIVYAYSLEKEQEWSGCVVDDSAIKKYNEHYQASALTNVSNLSLDQLIEEKVLVKYKVPYKTGPIEEKHVLNWPAASRTFLDKSRVREAFGKHNKNVDDWNVELKIKNTIEFLEEMKIR